MSSKNLLIRVQSSDLAALFDMLRYEGGRVANWTKVGASAYTGRDIWRLDIEVQGNRHQPDRWLSFGIRPQTIGAW